jgi:hypothetical protein
MSYICNPFFHASLVSSSSSSSLASVLTHRAKCCGFPQRVPCPRRLAFPTAAFASKAGNKKTDLWVGGSGKWLFVGTAGSIHFHERAFIF